MDIVLFATILTLLWQEANGLQCYQCTGGSTPTACNLTTTCSDNQGCYLKVTESTTGQRIDMGCKQAQECTSGLNIVGRALTYRQAPHSCLECCSHDLCNSDLCSHLKPSDCIDDETVDCFRMNSLLNLCNDVQHAKIICPKTCGLCQLVDGNWAPWSNWSSCDSTCGNGTQTRVRTCTDPAPENGGLDCTGEANQHNDCVKPPCPVHGGWSIWQEWGTCSVSCGIGLQRRDRSCSNPYPSLSGDHCFGESRDDRACMQAPCANGGWSAWESWNTCSVSCGTGLRHRYRTCDQPTPSLYGHPCVGNHQDTELCNKQQCSLYSDCSGIKKLNPNATDGIYKVYAGFHDIEVFCDMTTDGGGWTVFQRRFDGRVDFYKTFMEYKYGFGEKSGEHWLGLQYVHLMTSGRTSQLRLDLVKADNSSAHEVFNNFHIGAGLEYTLHIDRGTGTASDSGHGLSYHNGANFYTKDHDNSNGCAVKRHGGWWYVDCSWVNLNGDYAAPGTRSSYDDGAGGILYYGLTGDFSLKGTKMMFRRV